MYLFNTNTIILLFLVSKSTLGKVGKHWAPYYKICAPCFMNFDYIGILDPSQEENTFVWKALG